MKRLYWFWLFYESDVLRDYFVEEMDGFFRISRMSTRRSTCYFIFIFGHASAGLIMISLDQHISVKFSAPISFMWRVLIWLSAAPSFIANGLVESTLKPPWPTPTYTF